MMDEGGGEMTTIAINEENSSAQVKECNNKFSGTEKLILGVD